MGCQICKITGKALIPAIDLCEEVFDRFEGPDYEEMGIKTFKHFIRYENIRNMVDSEEMVFFGAYSGNELAGVIALRGKRHISLLFVREQYQRQGIAKKLLAVVVALCKTRELDQSVITVHAAPYAVEIYHRMGFAKISEEKISDGIRYTPMLYKFN